MEAVAGSLRLPSKDPRPRSGLQQPPRVCREGSFPTITDPSTPVSTLRWRLIEGGDGLRLVTSSKPFRPATFVVLNSGNDQRTGFFLLARMLPPRPRPRRERHGDQPDFDMLSRGMLGVAAARFIKSPPFNCLAAIKRT